MSTPAATAPAALPAAASTAATANKALTVGLAGLAVTALMVVITDYYTAKQFRPVQSVAEASKSGHGTNIIIGLSVGMESTLLPAFVIALGILGSYALSGIYGGNRVGRDAFRCGHHCFDRLVRTDH